MNLYTTLSTCFLPKNWVTFKIGCYGWSLYYHKTYTYTYICTLSYIIFAFEYSEIIGNRLNMQKTLYAVWVCVHTCMCIYTEEIINKFLENIEPQKCLKKNKNNNNNNNNKTSKVSSHSITNKKLLKCGSVNIFVLCLAAQCQCHT